MKAKTLKKSGLPFILVRGWCDLVKSRIDVNGEELIPWNLDWET
jgi:hypothetical protein